jgi:hypothetical protein
MLLGVQCVKTNRGNNQMDIVVNVTDFVCSEVINVLKLTSYPKASAF